LSLQAVPTRELEYKDTQLIYLYVCWVDVTKHSRLLAYGAPYGPYGPYAMDAMGRPSHLDVKDFPAGMKPVRTERSSDEIPPVVVG